VGQRPSRGPTRPPWEMGFPWGRPETHGLKCWRDTGKKPGNPRRRGAGGKNLAATETWPENRVSEREGVPKGNQKAPLAEGRFPSVGVGKRPPGLGP